MLRALVRLALVALAATPASAGDVEITVREDGHKVIKNEPREARARRLSGNLLSAPDPVVGDLIEIWAYDRGLDPRLVRAVVQVESGFNVDALSNKGAMGLMQLMPDTARQFGVENPWDPEQNVRGGTAYLRHLLDRFGDLDVALAAYNAGPEAVLRHSGVPPFDETRNYVERIFCLLDDGCTSGEREGRPVRIERDANNQIRMTTSGPGG